jgi:hypothetical protein
MEQDNGRATSHDFMHDLGIVGTQTLHSGRVGSQAFVRYEFVTGWPAAATGIAAGSSGTTIQAKT